jgi:hypothetical protein
MRVPDAIEPVLAWRAWRVVGPADARRLGSVVREMAWPVRSPALAVCEEPFWRRLGGPAARLHAAPHLGCACGIYASREPAEAFRQVAPPSRRSAAVAIGQVRLWGSVVEGPHGWRAEPAYPAAIHVLLRDTGRAARLAAESDAVALGVYDVPVDILECGVRPAREPAVSASGYLPRTVLRVSANRPAS